MSILFLFFGCNSQEKSAAEASPDNTEWYRVAGSKLSSDDNKIDVYALRFYPDNTYTLCADLLFETGKWSNDEAKEALILVPEKNGTGTPSYYIQEMNTPQGNTVFSFFDAFPFTDEPVERIEVQSVNNNSTFDPYKPAMHLWRKKPNASETKEQIKDRVRHYLKFLEALYGHAVENNLENPGGRWYAQPIKFYSNKVAMAYADELTDWYSCFFNDEEAIGGYKLISSALKKVKIKGEDDNNRNLDCIKQLLANL